MTDTPQKLLTLAQYNGSAAKMQGYYAGLQKGMSGNELPEKNPYPSHKVKAIQWQRGFKKAEKEIAKYQDAYDAQEFR